MAPKGIYEQVEDGESYVVGEDPMDSEACCDCGLVHDCKYRIIDGKIWVTVTRNNRKTGQLRRRLAGALQRGVVNGWRMVRVGGPRMIRMKSR